MQVCYNNHVEGVMKRILFKVVAAFFATCVLLFSCACTFALPESDGYDYSRGWIKVTEVQQCAPCKVTEFLGWNDYSVRQLFYALQSANVSSTYVVKVDGVEWTRMEMAMNELPEGVHEIYACTSDDFYLRKVDENGTLQKLPYKRAITITVDVSTEYPDVYDHQYRIDNGLWVHYKNAPWYPSYERKYLK